MAYARYGRDCDWYIFWRATPEENTRTVDERKAGQRLAIWHKSERGGDDLPEYSYAEVREMLDLSDFGRISGFNEHDRAMLNDCLQQFVRDVDQEYGASGT